MYALKDKKSLLIPAALTAVTTAAASGLSYLASYAVEGRRQTYEEAIGHLKEHIDISWYDSLEKVDYTISGYEDYQLHARLVYDPQTAEGDKYVIISHGHTDNMCGDLKYLPFYLELGFKCIIYDLRGHGANKEHICTYGVLESKDLINVIRDTYVRYGGNIHIGLHGESLGAATTLTALGEKPNVEFAVADCPFAELADILSRALAARHIPDLLVDLVSLTTRFWYGYSYQQMRPIDHLSDNTVPILFIHGAEDKFIIPDHSFRMAKATAGYSEVHLIHGAAHAMSAYTDPEAYRGYLKAFLDHIGVLIND